jgi:hypothetical protein
VSKGRARIPLPNKEATAVSGIEQCVVVPLKNEGAGNAARWPHLCRRGSTPDAPSPGALGGAMCRRGSQLRKAPQQRFFLIHAPLEALALGIGFCGIAELPVVIDDFPVPTRDKGFELGHGCLYAVAAAECLAEGRLMGKVVWIRAAQAASSSCSRLRM